MLNKVCIMGRLVRDPELRRTQSGVAVTTMRIAVDRDFKGPDGTKQADFFDVVAWRNTAEFVSRYFAKGRMMVVEGSLQNRDWTDRDGNKRVNTEIIADRIYFGDSRRDAPGGDANSAYGGYGAPSGGYGAPSGSYGAAPGYGNAPSGGYGSSYGGGYGSSGGNYGSSGYGSSGSYGASGGYGSSYGSYGATYDNNPPSGTPDAAPKSDAPASDGSSYPTAESAAPSAPAPSNGFAELSDDDGDLPF